MIRLLTVAALVTMTGMVAMSAVVFSEERDAKERDALVRALPQAQVPLERGMSASAREGVPLSAKFELEDGVFQLSVYTMSGDDFAEVIVDHSTGAVEKVTRITGGGDLSAAEAQRDAMVKATFSLVAAVVEAERANRGYRAVSVTPRLVDAHPLAEVILVDGSTWKTVLLGLD
jgi:hypothetical protein